MASSARIDELRKKFDENPRRYFAPLANEYRKAGDLEQAIFICQEYLPQQPGHMSGHIVYGQALFELDRHDEAKTVFETALSLDPENLIALKHLGDIARMGGDATGARMWYQRVLEADPRNEEIAQLMLSLLSTESAPEPRAATPTATPAVDHSAPTPLHSPAVSAPAQEPEAFAVEQSADFALDEPAPAPPPAVTPPRAAEAMPVSRHAPKEEELLDLDSFDLGGVPLSALRETKTEPADLDVEVSSSTELSFSNTPAESHDSEAVAETSMPTLDDEAFEADPFAIAAMPTASSAQESTPQESVVDEAPAPEIELATDMALGLPDDGVAPSFVEGGEKLDGLESFEAGIIPNAPALTESLAMESFFDTAAVHTPPQVESIAESMADQFTAAMQTREAPVEEPDVEAEATGTSEGEFSDILVIPTDEPAGESLAAEEPVAESLVAASVVDEAEEANDESSEPAAAFVTETMATLYLQQGHLDSALDIYRKLVDQRPDDTALRERMWEVETRVAEQRSMPADEPIDQPIPEPDVPAARTYGGPTIREFLSGIAARRPGGNSARTLTPEEQAFHSAETPLSTPVIPSADLASTEPEDDFSPVSPSRPTPSSSETVSGSIGVLFSGADAAADDAAAAQTLADAFQPETADNAPLHGVPAHRASSELSLNHVFKATTPTRGTEESAEDFSFDEFFTEGAATGSTPAADAPAVPAEGADDIAQFNAWLNGLKKT